MGLNSILEIFRADNWSHKLVLKFLEMLETAAEMFGFCMSTILYGEDDSDAQVELYDRDLHIHELQRDIRRRVLTRLSLLSSRGDIPTALIFVNAVKDAERIGDYMKNIYQLKPLLPADADLKLFQHHLIGRSKTIEDLFALTMKAFTECDQSRAEEVIRRAHKLGKQAEELISELVRSDLRTADAVCLVLIVRFYKRIAAHLSNIATSVVMPVDRLDFYDEPTPPPPPSRKS